MRLFKYFALIPLLCLAFSSCGKLVRENRVDCPGLLFFDLCNAYDFAREAPVFATVYRLPDDDFAADGTTPLEDLRADGYCFRIPKADYWSGYGLLGMQQCRQRGVSEWCVPEGQEWDPLYLFHFQVEGRAESVTAPVTFHKEYATLNITFVHLERFVETEGRFPFEVLINGNTCGIDAMTRSPIPGAFRFSPREEAAGQFCCRLPRQADNSLQLELWEKEGLYPTEGKADSIDLGQIIAEQVQLSWQEENLPEIYLEIDYVYSAFRVSISDWMHETHQIF